ncbi:hypothetical protein LRQ04_01385 [Paenarthrobacter sp. AR 02]|uniref:hypothetical protein n=1 Tax=Paenarthrobacter sp. AR 02 TaxID=2899821 RepID=UPI001F30DA31|nr:hypothetical protein [Paenarthrobacter sp. AR 02]MCF3137893.1 hypothetical protein [Paenarthrobacter sp. AR 02]
MSRRLLYRSAFWEIARPRHPLTAGHVLLRLSDPSTEFAYPSATDWLLCHNLIRTALRDVMGVVRCPIMFSYRWHPLGAAIGEPVAESSTPTFHLFGRGPGETTTPGHQLLLPAHRRVGEPLERLEATDDAIRDALVRARPAATAPLPDGVGTAVEPVLDPGGLVESTGAGRNHAVIQPIRAVGSIAEVSPAELLAMGAALGSLPLAGGLSGFSCLAPDNGATVRVHAMGRSAAEEANPLESLLCSPEVSLALL